MSPISRLGMTPPTTNATPTARPATAPAAAEAKASAPAGWSQGASGVLTIAQARIDEGPKTSDAVQVPKGYTATLSERTVNLKDTVHGREATFEGSAQSLKVAGQGTSVTISHEAGLEEFVSDWKGEMASLKADAPNEFSQLGWDASSNIRGVGTAGKLFSVSHEEGSYMGGAHPDFGTQLVTYDARSGKQVKLDELLSQKQMAALVKDIAARLPTLKGEDGLDAEPFVPMDGAAGLRDTINENFALTTGKNGQPMIEIAWGSGVHAMGGTQVHFTVPAPTDAAFNAKIGLD